MDVLQIIQDPTKRGEHGQQGQKNHPNPGAKLFPFHKILSLGFRLEGTSPRLSSRFDRYGYNVQKLEMGPFRHPVVDPEKQAVDQGYKEQGPEKLRQGHLHQGGQGDSAQEHPL